MYVHVDRPKPIIIQSRRRVQKSIDPDWCKEYKPMDKKAGQLLTTSSVKSA